jgi:hypothetical protein
MVGAEHRVEVCDPRTTRAAPAARPYVTTWPRCWWSAEPGQVPPTAKREACPVAALGLVLNAVVLWNSRHLDAAVAQIRAEGHDINDEDAARLSPLKDRHINFLGRYLFNIEAGDPDQGLRPFRDPDAANGGEDED